jgi:hypothetical protein
VRDAGSAEAITAEIAAALTAAPVLWQAFWAVEAQRIVAVAAGVGTLEFIEQGGTDDTVTQTLAPSADWRPR